MIKIADTPISDILEKLGAKGLRGTVIVPTKTGLEKSILDATEPIRAYLKSSGIHDFETQAQGTAHKVMIEGFVHLPGVSEPTKISLYRPETKSGDPRIWASGLNRYAEPGNVVAIVAHDGKLHLINLGRKTPDTLDRPSTELARLFTRQQQSVGFQHLLSSLRSIAAEGWIKSLRDGDTGVGYTLETKLGIAANSRRTPDYMGVELKSKRIRKGRISGERITLFSKTPDWKLTKKTGGMTPRELVNFVGTFSLAHDCKIYYATIYPSPNPQGVRAEIIQADSGQIFQTVCEREQTHIAHCWRISDLQTSLQKKHRETAFVNVESRLSSRGEEFLFTGLTYRSRPACENLEYLLSSGDITVDYTLSLPSSTRVRDHGYLFRMPSNRLKRLFAMEQKYELMASDEINYWKKLR